MKGYLIEGQCLNGGLSPLSAKEVRAALGLKRRLAMLEAETAGAEAAEVTWTQVPVRLDEGRGIYLTQKGAAAYVKARAAGLPDGCAAWIDRFPSLCAQYGYTPAFTKELAQVRPLWIGVTVPDMFRKGWQEAAEAASCILLSPSVGLDIPRLDEQLGMLKSLFPASERIVVCPLWDEQLNCPTSMGYTTVSFESLARYEQLGLIHGFAIRSSGDAFFCPEQRAFAEAYLARSRDLIE